jgi:hypothetical protein
MGAEELVFGDRSLIDPSVHIRDEVRARVVQLLAAEGWARYASPI